MEIYIENILITFTIFVAIIILIAVIALIFILLCELKYNFFLSNSTDNIYIKLSVNYIFGLLKFDAIYTNKLYVKFTFCNNISKYIPFLKNKEKTNDEINDESLNNNDEALEVLDDENKNVSYNFDDIDIDISEDFKKQEREYINTFNKNSTPDISKNIKGKYAHFRKRIALKRELYINFIKNLFSDEAIQEYKKIKEQLIIILNKIKPKEAHANIVIGIKDPYYLAKILIILSFFYVNYKNFNVVPMYNEDLFKGYIKFDGSFNIVSIVKPVYMLFKCDKIQMIIHFFGGKNGRKK